MVALPVGKEFRNRDLKKKPTLEKREISRGTDQVPTPLWARKEACKGLRKKIKEKKAVSNV